MRPRAVTSNSYILIRWPFTTAIHKPPTTSTFYTFKKTLPISRLSVTISPTPLCLATTSQVTTTPLYSTERTHSTTKHRSQSLTLRNQLTYNKYNKNHNHHPLKTTMITVHMTRTETNRAGSHSTTYPQKVEPPKLVL
ncbi:hypothetical protein M758_2G016400, partial [Ceratodon purpureus]